MSLQVWLPLNGDAKNYGLANVTTTAASGITYVDGKIGKCANAASSVSITATVPNLSTMLANGKTYSLACWVKVKSVGANGWAVKLGTNTCGLWWGYSPARWVWNENDNGKNANKTLAADTNWHHLVTTVDKTVTNQITTKNYVDGVLSPDFPSITWNSSGQAQPAGDTITITPYVAMLNDIRLYDHVLSPKEIKEISKGLVCHYLLNNNGSGMPNLVAGTSCNEVQYTYPSEGFVDRWAATTPAVPSASQYTLSFFAKSTVNGDQIRAHWYNPNTTTRCESSQGVVTTSGDGCINITLSTEWKFYWIVYTQSETTAVKHLILPRMGRSDIAPGTGTVSIKCVKLEEGNKATPWCPYTSDASYSIFNINGNKEIDTSGYGNHGTKNGTIIYNSNTPRYSISTIFNGSNTFIACGRGGMVKDAITISSWVYADNWANINTIWSCTEGGGWSSGKDGSVYRFYMGTGTSSNTYKTVDAMALSSITTGWHLITGTYDGFNVKIYIDGVLKGTNAAYTTKTPIFYASANGIFIGAEAGGNQTTPAGSYTACKISDFRIYATALSADDIKQLYQVSASIDNNGNVFCSDIQEV